MSAAAAVSSSLGASKAREDRASLPKLIVISDLGTLSWEALLRRSEVVAGASTPGSVAILLRDHAASAAERLRWGRELQRIASRFEQLFWVADRLDLALLLNADGVHLGEKSVSSAAARRLVGAQPSISRAWHRPQIDPVDQLEQLQDVDALLLSPIIAGRKQRPPLGLSAISALRAALSSQTARPAIYALGGIDAENAAACVSAGATGVAAIGSALTGDYPALLAALAIAR